jgi:hypothetical protein
MAALLDRVYFLSTVGGTTDFGVSSALTGYMTPASAGAVNGATYYYVAESASKTEWELGLGTYSTTGPTLARTTVIFSSNSNAKVNFTNPPNVFITLVAETKASSTDFGLCKVDGTTVTSASGVLSAGAGAGTDKIKVYMSGALNTHADSTFKKIALDAVSYDTNSIWDSSNKRVIPKKAGYYAYFLRLRTNSSGANVTAIGFNGSAFEGAGPDFGTSVLGTGGSGIIQCNGSTDYLELFAFSSSSRTVTTGTFDSYMEVVGPL